MRETTFNNITITVPADSPKAAYALLCQALATIEAEWKTDTYTEAEGEELSTTKLFPHEYNDRSGDGYCFDCGLPKDHPESDHHA